MGRMRLAPTALNKLAQGRARNERRPGLLGPKKASPVRARQTVATFVTPASGLTAFASIYPGLCFLARPTAALFPTATSLGWLVKGLWPMPKNSHQTVARLKRSTLEKPPWLFIFNCIVTVVRSRRIPFSSMGASLLLDGTVARDSGGGPSGDLRSAFALRSNRLRDSFLAASLRMTLFHREQQPPKGVY